jgi:hypothetical protein
MDPLNPLTPTRRGFLTSILALSAAPAVIKADSLMEIVVPKWDLPLLYGDGLNDDTVAMQLFLAGHPVLNKGRVIRLGLEDKLIQLPEGDFHLSSPILISIRDGATVKGAGNYGTKFIAAESFRGNHLLHVKMDPQGDSTWTNFTFESEVLGHGTFPRYQWIYPGCNSIYNPVFGISNM